MSSNKRSAAKGFAPRPLVRINSSMAGNGERTAITQEQSLEQLTKDALKKGAKKAVAKEQEIDPVSAIEEPQEETPQSEEPNVSEETPQQEEAPPTVALSREHIDLLTKTASEKAVAEERARLEAAHQAEVEAMQARLNAATQAAEAANEAAQKASEEKEVLAGVFNTLGYTEPVTPSEAKAKEMASPHFNQHTTTNSDEPIGAVKEALDILDASDAITKTMSGGTRYVYADQTELNRFVKKNRPAVLEDLERWGKRNGLMRGNQAIASYAQTKAATTIGDIPGGFLDVLSAVMRSENRGRFVWWQFPITVHQYNKGMGNQAEIPRSAYIPAPASSSERVLSGPGVYRQIDPGNQNISTGVELATLIEYGLGGSPTAAAVMIPTFINSYSLIDLMAILQRNLMRDYYNTEEVAIREQYKKTNAVVYNNNGVVTTTPTAGALTTTFLNKLFAYMQELRIPTYDNGCYCIVEPSSVIADFKNSLQGTSALWLAPSVGDLQALTNILNPTTIGSGEFDRVTGYVGTYSNFMIFDTNSYGVGTPTVGGINGVQNEGAIGVTKSGLAFGADAVGRGIGTEFQIVQDEKTDFGRSNRFIWRSEEVFHALDVAPQPGDTRPLPQQLRVIETRLN